MNLTVQGKMVLAKVEQIVAMHRELLAEAGWIKSQVK